MSPFEPTPPPFPIPSAAPVFNTVERPKKERKKREAKPKAEKPAAAPKKAKKKAKPVSKPKADTISVSLKEFAGMRAGAHAKLFMKVHKLLAGESKAARKVVLAEIAKVLA